MTLQKPSPGLAPAENYARFSTAFDAIDSLGAARAADNAEMAKTIAAETDARDKAIAIEARTRSSAFNELTERLSDAADSLEQVSRTASGTADMVKSLDARADASDRALAILDQDVTSIRSLGTTKVAALEQLVGTAALVPRDRIGENLFLFTSRIEGVSRSCPPLPEGNVVVTQFGPVLRTTGTQIVARRAALWLEPSRTHAVRWIFKRFSKPADPDDDRIRCGIACLDANGRLIATLIVRDYPSVDPMSGMQVLSARFPSQAGDPVQLQPPAGCVFWRPYFQTFGLDGVTDFVLLADSDVTDAGSYAPDLTDLRNQIAGLQTAVAQLSPLAAGVASGLATLDGTGTVIQLPMLKVAFLSAAAQLVPGALEIIDNAVALQGDEAIAIAHRSPYLQADDAWSTFTAATLGLTDTQVASIFAAIGSPSQRSGYQPPNPVFDLDVTTAAVVRAARARFAAIPGASMKNFVATKIGDEDASDDSYAALYVDRHAPVTGALYNLLLSYLISPAPGPALSQQAAAAHLTAIWTAASSIST